MQENVQILDLLVKLTQLVGIPVAIGVYGLNKRRERLDREYGTYDALDDKYIEYLTLCLQNKDLDTADWPMASPPVLTAEQKHRELILFSILIAILERSFLMYEDKSAKIREKQWTGWEAYAKDWLTRENFKAAWQQLRVQFDKRFVGFMDSL